MIKQGYWFCRRCNYQEPVSKFKQSQTRFCPKCFGFNREQVPMLRREGKAPMPMRNFMGGRENT